MIIYKLLTDPRGNSVIKFNDNNSWLGIPFTKDNSDFIQFKKDIANGAELQDSTGTVMTASQIQAFIATLP